MRLTELRARKVRTLDGDSLGRVHEIHCEDGRIVALMAGPGSFIERLTAKQKGRRIPWDRVLKIEAKQILVAPNARKGRKS